MNLRFIIFALFCNKCVSGQKLPNNNGKQLYQDGAVIAHIIGSGGLNNEYYFNVIGVQCEMRNPGFWDVIEKDHKKCKSLKGGVMPSTKNFGFDKFCTNWRVTQQCNTNLALDLDDCLGSQKGTDALRFLNAYLTFTCGNVRNTEAHLTDRFTKNALVPGSFKCFPTLHDRIVNCVKKDKTSTSFCGQFYTVRECYGKFYRDHTCHDPLTIQYMRDLFQSMSDSLRCPQNPDDWNERLFPNTPFPPINTWEPVHKGWGGHTTTIPPPSGWDRLPPRYGEGWEKSYEILSHPHHGWGATQSLQPDTGWSNGWGQTTLPPRYGNGWGDNYWSQQYSQSPAPLGSWYPARFTPPSSKGDWSNYDRYGAFSRETWDANRLRSGKTFNWDDNKRTNNLDGFIPNFSPKIPPYNVRYVQPTQTTSGEVIFSKPRTSNRLRAGSRDRHLPSKVPKFNDKYIYIPTTRDGSNRKLRSDGPTSSTISSLEVEQSREAITPLKRKTKKRKRKGSSTTTMSTTTEL